MSSSFGNFGFQPSSRIAFSAEATSLGGSPGRRGFSTAGNFFAGHFFAHLNDLPHGIAIAVAEVVKSGLARLQAQDVRLREVKDVDVIADARAVGRRIIRAENLALRLPGPARLSARSG